MTNLDSILNAADRAAVTESNFQKLDLAAGLSAVDANVRMKSGQLQIYDAAAPDPTKPWYPLLVNAGAIGLGDAVAE